MEVVTMPESWIMTTARGFRVSLKIVGFNLYIFSKADGPSLSADEKSVRQDPLGGLLLPLLDLAGEKRVAVT